MTTLSASNELTVTCPTLGVETKLADCFILRDRVWRGEKPTERRGCQACMAASKCAAAAIVHDMWVSKVDPGYFSATSKHGSLDASLVDRLGRVIVPEKTLDLFGVVDPERAVILASNEAGRASKRAAIDTSDWAQEKPKRRSSTKPTIKAQAPDNNTVAAAVAGDMSAAVNRAAQAMPAATSKPVPKPEPVVASTPAATTGLSLLERARLAKQGRAA
jgi:hypothetical protein